MAPKNPVSKLAETARAALKDPMAAAGKVVDQAKGTVVVGRLVAETAGSIVGDAAGRLIGRKGHKAPGPTWQPSGVSRTRSGDLKAVPDVNEPAHTRAEDSPKKHGDVLSRPPATAKKALAKTAPPTKAPAAKKAAAKPPAAKQAPAEKAAPAKKATPSPAEVAEVVEAAVAKDPNKTAAQPAKKTAEKASAAKKAPAKKAGPGGRLPAKKSRPRTAAEVAADEGEEVVTQAGTTAASEGMNPSTGDTSLTQSGTPPVVDESVAKSVASESEQLRKAAEPNPE